MCSGDLKTCIVKSRLLKFWSNALLSQGKYCVKLNVSKTGLKNSFLHKGTKFQVFDWFFVFVLPMEESGKIGYETIPSKLGLEIKAL